MQINSFKPSFKGTFNFGKNGDKVPRKVWEIFEGALFARNLPCEGANMGAGDTTFTCKPE